MHHDVTILVEDVLLPTLDAGAIKAPPVGKRLTWQLSDSSDAKAYTTFNSYDLVFNGYL